MKLAYIVGGKCQCQLCGWEVPCKDTDSGEVLVRAHLRAYHQRWMVNRDDIVRRGVTTVSFDGPRWTDTALGFGR